MKNIDETYISAMSLIIIVIIVTPIVVLGCLRLASEAVTLIS